MQSRHLNRFQYFREQANTSKNYYVSYIRHFFTLTADTRVLEIGCGEGGNLLPFAKLGCTVTGIDIDHERTEQAVLFFQQTGQDGRFLCHDFMTFPSPKKADERFDIIIVHDVMEHIPPSEKQRFLMHIHCFLRQGGVVFVGFPAWQNPFGGHQQISVGFASKLPYIHLYPNCVYRRLLYYSGATPEQIDELLRIKQARLTIEKFERLAKMTGFTIADRILWLINPHYQQKFHLSPRRLGMPWAALPYLRNYLTTSAFYILKDQ